MVFYEPGKTSHGLPRDPFKSCVTPRPIGWISSKSKDGVDNLAPFSQFNNLTFDPPYVMFASNQDLNHQRKNTVDNVEATHEFCWNMATWDLREAVNASAEWFTDSVDEFEKTGLEKEQASTVNVPMVKASPIKFECRYYTTIRLPGTPPMGSVDVVVGRVVGIHIDERVLTDGKVDLGKAMPIARCGYHEYVVVKRDAMFEMIIPGDPKQLVGLEGNAEKNQKIELDGYGASRI
ncbi:hypothetical protein M409DRAFT_63865 [Zasmidium cellare ATCC 36951]|uniref:Flavin reductase like domain-containing protein n=1 Tax=Zasmidium cellare ATCC 36951 TaxID=1080233 RepID=A0A6A6CX52_ZASCE|nr:uncharacterized protein M409DRAFT_63865 [Zasmidium cellare ATCC 36951]KAF2170808.1 hypothetical protein M409DRAFT_63865 [Zasmidium cellare ATCC 36951]